MTHTQKRNRRRTRARKKRIASIELQATQARNAIIEWQTTQARIYEQIFCLMYSDSMLETLMNSLNNEFMSNNTRFDVYVFLVTQVKRMKRDPAHAEEFRLHWDHV